MATDQRTTLERLIREHGADYASLSRLLGRNAAYIQQFIKRGTPRQLAEEDRRILAHYFGVSEASLGGPQDQTRTRGLEGLVVVQRLDISASAGSGAEADGELVISEFAFSERWLRDLCRGRRPNVSMIRVQGDSMAPTLVDGDEILVERLESAERVRDGIYVLRQEDTLLVKRLAIGPSAQSVRIRSDNPAYPEWPECDLASLQIIGRVIWAGHTVS